MRSTEIVDLVADFALFVAWIAVVVLPLLPLARKTAQIEKLGYHAETRRSDISPIAEENPTSDDLGIAT